MNTTIPLIYGNVTQRPATPAVGELRFNTTTLMVEMYDGNNWIGTNGMMQKRILKWVDTANRNTLSARVLTSTTLLEHEIGARESDLDPVQKWCVEHNCGVRTSFDHFKFRNKKEMTMFLLRWGDVEL